MGNTFGRPNDVERQRAILQAALELVESAEEGGVLVDLPDEWEEPFTAFFSVQQQ